MGIQGLTTKTIKKLKLSQKVYLVRFSIPENYILDFIPGQFMSISVGGGLRRSYSLSNNPVGTDYLETIVDISPGGVGSKFFEELQVGDEVSLLVPLGRFVYAEADRPVHFYATGTGMAPFLSMIEYSLVVLGTKRQISLHWGFRYEDEIFFSDKLKELSIKYPHFSYSFYVSKPSSNWKGYTGYVYQLIEKELHDPDIDAYLCGGTGMIESTSAELVKAGVPEEQIYFEKYY